MSGLRGDAILIAPEKTILIDAGPTESSSQVEGTPDLGRKKIDTSATTSR